MKRATENYIEMITLWDISIHALVKRATMAFENGISGYVISIHALVKRATNSVMRKIDEIEYFNPRPREEGDGINRML